MKIKSSLKSIALLVVLCGIFFTANSFSSKPGRAYFIWGNNAQMVPNGIYSDCVNKDFFWMTSNGIAYKRYCPPGLVWFNNVRRCEWETASNPWRPSDPCVYQVAL